MLEQLVLYRKWLCSRSGQHRIFLLRDTLLLYLADRAEGNTAAVPLLIGRKFLDRIDPSFYNDVVLESFYDLVSVPGLGSGDLLRGFRDLIRARTDAGTHPVMDQIRRLLDGALAQEQYAVVESGFQGTIPLLLRAADLRASDFAMYTTLPWLGEIYKETVFRQNYHYLREMETLAAHDSLFEFDSVKDGRIFIREYRNETVRAMAFHEIVSFRRLCGL